MSDYHAYVYIMASTFRRLYIGVTTEIEIRVRQHKSHTNPNCHTAKYNIHDLVYFERYSSILAAIRREKVLKGWLRIRKLDLIISTNPEWKDLSASWGTLAEPFDLTREKDLLKPRKPSPQINRFTPSPASPRRHLTPSPASRRHPERSEGPPQSAAPPPPPPHAVASFTPSS